jgi:hypothetical protein
MNNTSNGIKNARVRELPLLPDVARDPNAVEFLRAWLVNGLPQATLYPMWQNPEAWGLFLAQTIQHVARVYALEGICSESDALRQILGRFACEWENPTLNGQTVPYEPVKSKPDLLH